MTNNYSMIYADLNSSSTIWDWVNSTGGQIELTLEQQLNIAKLRENKYYFIDFLHVLYA